MEMIPSVETKISKNGKSYHVLILEFYEGERNVYTYQTFISNEQKYILENLLGKGV